MIIKLTTNGFALFTEEYEKERFTWDSVRLADVGEKAAALQSVTSLEVRKYPEAFRAFAIQIAADQARVGQLL